MRVFISLSVIKGLNFFERGCNSRSFFTCAIASSNVSNDTFFVELLNL